MNTQRHPKVRCQQTPGIGQDEADASQTLDEVVEQACSVAEAINQALEAAASATSADVRAWNLSGASVGLDRLVAMTEYYPFIVLQGMEAVQAQIRQLTTEWH